MENVKALVQKKFKLYFEEWLKQLEEMGYTTYWQVLNATDYGLPQNRERVIAVSILNDTEGYEFPPAVPLELKLKDLLEPDEFKKTKEEMKRLGFDRFEEYEEYLEFIELQQKKKAQKNKDFEM